MPKVVLIVLDSVGIGEAPDAADYGDAGAATLQHIAETSGPLALPTFAGLGLGNIPALLPGVGPIKGLAPAESPLASYGAMQERSEGKDTITGHWEIAGLHLSPGFHLFPPGPPSFPDELVGAMEKAAGRKLLGNCASGGVAIMKELGEQHLQEPSFIAYTSADSVIQIAAHTDVLPVEELHALCKVIRTICDPYRVGRVIARPFEGKPGAFQRTRDRKDFAYLADEPTILERLHDAAIPVYAVGKIEDIFAQRGITESDHTGDNLSSQEATLRFYREKEEGLIFANFIDFDMLYGHQRKPDGYARCLEQSDGYFAGFLREMQEGDLLIITADHGNDPTFKGTDHTREYVPLLVYQPGRPGRDLGIRDGFYDVAQSIAHFFNQPAMPRGVSFF